MFYPVLSTSSIQFCHSVLLCSFGSFGAYGSYGRLNICRPRSWLLGCDLLNATQMLDAEELFVACRTFKAELQDVADEEIRLRSRDIIFQHDYDQAAAL